MRGMNDANPARVTEIIDGHLIGVGHGFQRWIDVFVQLNFHVAEVARSAQFVDDRLVDVAARVHESVLHETRMFWRDVPVLIGVETIDQ